ncbi:hypothetical protein [Agromyces bauzanensis]|uniref:Uncharacterized protein n=1 Tax=Agromyces bauzanensis TaxID=1308924 RepID=A0A917PRH8_9MICO|nr:hypothetical protein [Agromyces bauzanensis]GGJ89111.1 hypothetical protein GCM10011372_29660 [Agromyces bauzanensis]
MTTTPVRRATTPWLIAIIAVLGAAVLVLTTALPTLAITTAAESATAPWPAGLRAGAVRELPPELRADLLRIADAPPEERAALRAEVRTTAETGGYGPRVRLLVETLDARLGELPAELQADIEALREAEPEERRALARELRDGVLAGEYGSELQEKAEELRELFEREGLRAVLRSLALGADR